MTEFEREYAAGTVMGYRKDTDRLFQLPAGSVKFDGPLMDAVLRIQKEQCLDAFLWKLFAEQFRLGSVDDHDDGWRCEFWGKMMRGACFTYRVTQDAGLYSVLAAAVREIISLADKDGRVSTYSVNREFHGWDIWGRKYILLGMQYFIEICDDEAFKQEIIAFMMPFTDYIIAHIGDAAEGKTEINETGYAQWGGMNSSTVLEPVVRMYMLTGEIRYLEFADYIVERGGCNKGNLFELAYEGRLFPYQYPVIKAYEMMSVFEGLLEYYRVTGVHKWRVAVENFARLVAQSDVTIIGCSGCTHELFDHSGVRQLDTSEKGIIQETCVTVTWMKLCNQLLCLTGDSFFADEMEKSIYNSLLGAINTAHKKPSLSLQHGCVMPENVPADYLPNGLPFDSYSPILPGYRGRGCGGYKVMQDTYYYGCCACIGAAGTGLIGMAAADAASDGLAVNFFLNGSYTGAGFELESATDFPVSGDVAITVKAAPEGRSSLRIRIPYWSKKTEVSVNGEAVTRIVSGNYLTISRAWKAGDRICISLDMGVQAVFPEEYGVSSSNAPFIAFRRGPVLLCRTTELGDDVDKPLAYKLDADSRAEFTLKDDPRVPAQIAGELTLEDGTALKVAEYSSCGKHWLEDKIAAWMPRD